MTDGLGVWWQQTPLDTLPDPVRPYQEFTFLDSPSRNWQLAVDYLVLAVPGPRLKLEV